MKIDHSAKCPCGVVGLTCERISEMRQEICEIMDRAESLPELIELATSLGKTEEEKFMYNFIFGREWEVKIDKVSNFQSKSGPNIRVVTGRGIESLFTMLRKIAEEGRNPNDEDDDGENG